ncbi:hypothetical protein CH371_15515 [Leptospira wolffii]|uniref:Uncharacterized protein n=1 Tax=Leptospira wolffii TaxID=409998 RepID=A0A2M9Z911_9LEPT|nr:hypothetical protein CH371_15515 [Leptospira wolffii]
MYFARKSPNSNITREFVDLFKKAFPNVEGEQLSSLELMLQQFSKRSFNFRKFPPEFESTVEFQITKKPDDILMQGDIISDVPIIFVDDNGDLSQIEGPAVVLSASCDCENDDTIILSGCLSYQEAKSIVRNAKDLQNNLLYKFFSFNNSSDESQSIVADFSRVGSFSKSLIQTRIETGKLKKIRSLTQLGYYYFITKLYIHLLRIEGSEALTIRE